MNRSGDDVLGRLAAQLDDVLAKVRLDRLETRRLKRLVESDLLGNHRFALGDAFRSERVAEVDDDPAGFLCVFGVVDMAAALDDLPLVCLEIEIEVGERVVFDRPGAVAQRLEFRQPGGGVCAPDGEVARMAEGPGDERRSARGGRCP